MTAVITGDLVSSQKKKPDIWMPVLEDALQKFSASPSSWEIFRGDSFQCEVAIDNVFQAVIYLRASLKTISGIDVRTAVGVGKITYQGASITKSNGEAFINSGEAFEKLKKKKTLVKTPWKELDEQINLIFDLLELILENWNTNTSKTVLYALRFPEINQSELAEKLGKKQSQISRELKKTGFEQVKMAADYCTKITQTKC